MIGKVLLRPFPIDHLTFRKLDKNGYLDPIQIDPGFSYIQ